ncbi:glycosyltransferase family 4 protein [Microbulbifer agarilyticus]
MKPKVLLVIESCNPEMSSVPLVGYNFFKIVSGFADVELVTHCRNKEALERAGFTDNVTYYFQSGTEIIYYRIIAFFTSIRGQVIWPLRHALQFPIYFFFNRFVKKQFSQRVTRGEFDIVHALTPIMPRFPYSISSVCKNAEGKTPFILGPVNGGVPYPEAFQDIGRKEFSYLNWLRRLGSWLVPGYRSTYKNADVILTGSTYTDEWLKNTFPSKKNAITLMYENAVNNAFYKYGERSARTEKNLSSDNDTEKLRQRFRLLFLGRLEPYKGCDMVLNAISQLSSEVRGKISFTIVGDGSQRKSLEKYVEDKELGEYVDFTGWVSHDKVPSIFAQTDLFCFPSVREFGGAVVMEAMATGMPCIVVKNGGIGEYVTEESGFRIPPVSRDFVVNELAEKIERLVNNPDLYDQMAIAAKGQATEYSWDAKSRALQDIYKRALAAQGAFKERILNQA